MKGNLQYINYTPEDIFWGELGGLLEAVDGGTTTIVDHAHLSKTPNHGISTLELVDVLPANPKAQSPLGYQPRSRLRSALSSVTVSFQTLDAGMMNSNLVVHLFPIGSFRHLKWLFRYLNQHMAEYVLDWVLITTIYRRSK